VPINVLEINFVECLKERKKKEKAKAKVKQTK
jgi:hypothetical protein